MVENTLTTRSTFRILLFIGLILAGLVLLNFGLFDLEISGENKAIANGVAFGVIAISMVFWKMQLQNASRIQIDGALAKIIDVSPYPAFITDTRLNLISYNKLSRARYPVTDSKNLIEVFKFTFADPAQALELLVEKSANTTDSKLELSTDKGEIRLSARRIEDNLIYWCSQENSDGPDNSDNAPSLPMVSVSKSGTVLYMNEAMRLLLGERVKSLDRIFMDLPLRNGQLHDVTTANGTQRFMVAEIQGISGRYEIYLLPDYKDVTGESCGRLFEGLPVPMLKMDADGKVLAANKLARDLLGVQDIYQYRLVELVQGLGRSVTDWLADAAQGRGLSQSQVLRAKKTEKEVFIQISLTLAQEAGGPILTAVLTDATELKTLEAQFVQSQKMQAIGQLAGGVAHDFNNLLTAISGHCDLLLLRHDLGDPDYNDLIQINQNANRAASLVGQLLAFSRKQNLQPECIDLRDTMSELTHLLNRLVGETVSLTLSHDPNLKSIRADKRQFEQVLMNLVVNARDAMQDGGDIRIVTQNLTLDQELTRDRATIPVGDYVMISVYDQGVGIAPDKIDKVFEPFYTTKKVGEGTGLGLSTVYGIVKQSGGYVFAENNNGKGVCFSVYLPAYQPPPEIKEEPEVIAARSGFIQEDGVILLVEDEAPVRAFASRALRMRGYTVLEAENAEVALETVADQDLKIDVFVTDVIMPGLDGPTWVKEAMKTRPDVKVVFVSGYAEDDFADNQQQIPNSVFLAKPFSLKELTNTVQQQLH